MTALAPIGLGEAAVRSTFAVEGLRCAGCIAKLEGALAAMPGVIAARVNFGAGRVTVEHLEVPDEDALCAAIDALGFRAHVFAGEIEASGDAESRSLLLALAVAGFAAMNIMLLSVAIWSGAEGSTRQMFHELSALIALPTIAYAGRPFFRSAWRALRHGTTNMDVPISIGVVLTAAMSLYETATGGAHAYFDGAVMLLFFLLAGRALDSVMRARARDGVAALLRRVPRDALVLLPDGTTQRRQTEELAPGMRVLVAAGERIGVDGKVEQGDSSVDRALVTGESLPERVSVDSAVLAGTINLSSPLVVRATATGASTAIADIARLMDSAGQGKSRYVRIADRASRLYAPAVHTFAALTLVGWLLAGAGLHAALMTAVAVLIITCPCALGLAVPIAQVVAAGALLRSGVLIKDGSALERLAKVDRVLLDKTGTVTLGRLQPTSGLPADATERGMLLALAQASRHPLSRAIAGSLGDAVATRALTEVNEEAGLGVEAMLGTERVRLGRADWVAGGTCTAIASATEAVFRIGAAPAYHIMFSDTPRPDARAAIDRLAALGLAPSFVSGDSAAVVDRLATTLGIPGRARLSPADKHEAVAALDDQGHHVLMVGDGLNDGPALRRAFVAMAPASASDVGQMAADAVFLGETLMPVPLAIVVARRTMRVVQQNFALAIGYNLLAVPIAMAGMVTPLIAALAMSGSSLVVVANALRLRRAAR
jgi:Cu2+-exporting ATPase